MRVFGSTGLYWTLDPNFLGQRPRSITGICMLRSSFCCTLFKILLETTDRLFRRLYKRLRLIICNQGLRFTLTVYFM